MELRLIIAKFVRNKKVFIPTTFILFFGLATFTTLKQLPAPDINVNSTITFYDIEGTPFLKQTYPKRQKWVKLDDISPHVTNGFIATEDRHFNNHLGFDLLGIFRSLLTNFSSGQRVQGASTITQQYAKNLFLSFEKTWSRKMKEAFYTIRLEHSYDKETILEGYLNTINFGHGNYGIEDAAHFYFNKSASKLTLAEAAILVGIPKGPSHYSPINHYERAIYRQNTVLNAMLRDEYITQEEYDQALNSQLSIIGETPKIDFDPSYFIDGVLTELHSLLADSKLTQNLHVYTTFNREIQTHINDAIERNIVDDEVQTAVIVLEPETGYVLGLSGGTDFQTSQYNRALNSERQVGSLLKPILYFAALEFGFNPSTSFISQPTSFVFNNGSDSYNPRNFSSQYPYDQVSMANALAVSDNIYAVKTHTFLGMSVLPNMANRLGITAQIPEIPSAALGVTSISIMEMAEAYAVFANKGRTVDHRFITQVKTEKGAIIYEGIPNENKQILDPNKTFIFNEMMTGMFNMRHNNHLAVTGLSIIPNLTHAYAGKTGTTQTDSWMIGYTPELATTVWTGYDEGRLLNDVETLRYAKNIWAHIMEASLNQDASWFEAPKNVIPVSIDPFSGSLATKNCKKKITLYYEESNLPNNNNS